MTTTDLADTYGSWAVVAGGSDGIGASFAYEMAARGMNIFIVARRVSVLDAIADDIRSRLGVEVRTLSLDLSVSDAVAELARATSDLEVGIFVYNVGGDDRSAAFLDKDVETHLALVRRNCDSVIEAAYRFGSPMVKRGRGAMVLVTSGAAWAGGVTLAAYGAPRPSISFWPKACGPSGVPAGSTSLAWCSARPTPRLCTECSRVTPVPTVSWLILTTSLAWRSTTSATGRRGYTGATSQPV